MTLNNNNFSDSDFEKILSEFYFELLNSQENLGAEFEKVIHDNRWNLYER